MKKIIVIIALLMTAVAGHAEGYWPRTFFFSAGMGIAATKGDLNEIPITIKDSLNKKETVHTPAMEIIGNPDFKLGVNIREFTLGVSFQYWKSTEILAEFPDESHKESNRLWRLGFDFSYNFFWPEFFQVGVGLGYSYTNIKTKNSAFFEDKIGDSELMGSGITLFTNMRYYISDHIALVPSLNLYEFWIKSVHTSQNGTCDLDSYLWQTMVSLTLSVQVQF